MDVFNIFGKIEEEVSDFDKSGVYIVGRPEGESEYSTNKGKKGGYYFSQRETLEAIVLATASKFKRGIYDDEKQRKTYLNIVNFFRDVMKMKININVSDYIFEPLSASFAWIVWLFSRQFKTWASMNDYDDEIDDFADDLATFGTCVAIRLDDCSDRVPLRSIRNTQTAASLYDAAANGGYVILENEFHYNVMKTYPDWNIDGLDKNKKYQVYQRFGLVPEGLLKNWEKLTAQQISQYQMKTDEEMALAMAIVVPQGADTKAKGERLLYMEAHDEDSWPLDECHAEQRDGRWLGIGEVEKQLEAQMARNLNANLRRRGILWATKKIFWSTDENVQSNLVMEVKDGDVLKLGQNKQMGQLNVSNQHTNDIKIDDETWTATSKENSFAFEVATGEALPSGTPFRLGVIMQNAVAQHFTLVRQTFSRFLKRCYFNQLVPVFKREYRQAHNVVVNLGESDIENLKQEMIDYHTNDRIWNYIITHKAGQPGPNVDQIRQQVSAELARNAYAFISVPKKAYDDIEYMMNLNLTDDIQAEVADLTTLYQAMAAKGDPRAENVLRMIFAKRGESLDNILGPAPAAAPAAALPAGGGNEAAPANNGAPVIANAQPVAA